MNTTMAPTDQVRQNSLEDLRRRHDRVEEISLTRRQDGDGDGNGRGRGGGGRSKNSDNDDDDDDDNDDGKGKGRKKGDGNGPQRENEGPVPAAIPVALPPPPPPLSGPLPPPPPPEPAPPGLPTQDTTTVMMPTTVVVTETMPMSPSSSTVELQTSILSTPTSTFAIISTPESSQPTATQFPPQKGLETNGPSSLTESVGLIISSSSSSSWTRTKTRTGFPPWVTFTGRPSPESAVASQTGGFSNSSRSRGNPNFFKNRNKKSGDLSPTAERLLVAAGAIGAFIIVATGFYFLYKRRKVNAFSKLGNQKTREGRTRGLFGWRKDKDSSDPPPTYPDEKDHHDFPIDEKSIQTQQPGDGYFNPIILPPLAKPESVAISPISQRQESARQSLLENVSPITYSPQQQNNLSATQSFYNMTSVDPTLARQLPNTNDTMRTQNTFSSQQTSNLHNPSQIHVNHMSYLSSLSSGFGDGLIAPEQGATKPGQNQTFRPSLVPGVTRLSWAQKQQQTGNRDTVYTTTSEDSAPRFRTVNSWVANQTGRVERAYQAENEIPNMPAVPVPLQNGLNHQRNVSEDPVFKFHPGEEIQISRGSRVPSEILNKRTGIN